MKKGAAEVSRKLKTKLKTLSASMAIIDPSGTIVAVNDTWKLFARQNGLRLPNFGIGSNYLDYCLSDESLPSLRAKELKELLAGQRSLITLIYPCHSPKQKRWFSLIAFPLSFDDQAGVAILHIDLTRTFPLSTEITDAHARNTDNPVSVNTMSRQIEESILETLSSQLTRMFSRNRRSAGVSDTSTQPNAEALAKSVLSKRQMEVLRLLGEGKTNKEIAQAFFRSPHTIKLHVAAILERLKLRSRTEAALIASKIYKESSSDSPKIAPELPKRAHADSWHRSGHSFRDKTLVD